MEQVKIIVELLAMVDFNFWQIFGFVVILLFRKQIVAIFDRIITIKSPVGEICLVPEKSKVVEKFENIKEKVSSLPDDNDVKNEISEGLQSLNKEILIDALERIRTNTTYLWPALESAYEKQQTKIQSVIRNTTLAIIKNDLELLKSFDLLKYSYKSTVKIRKDSILEIIVEIHDKLFELIKIIQDRN
jgi:hypothetical protein